MEGVREIGVPENWLRRVMPVLEREAHAIEGTALPAEGVPRQGRTENRSSLRACARLPGPWASIWTSASNVGAAA
jgi:hypothetical protein